MIVTASAEKREIIRHYIAAELCTHRIVCKEFDFVATSGRVALLNFTISVLMEVRRNHAVSSRRSRCHGHDMAPLSPSTARVQKL